MIEGGFSSSTQAGADFARLGTEVARARVEGEQLRRAQSEANQAVEEAGASRAKEAARGFEQIFARMLASELRKGLGEGFFGSGPGAETFSGWLDDFVGEAIAERGSLGLERMLEDVAFQQVNGPEASQQAAADTDQNKEVAP